MRKKILHHTELLPDVNQERSRGWNSNKGGKGGKREKRRKGNAPDASRGGGKKKGIKVKPFANHL